MLSVNRLFYSFVHLSFSKKVGWVAVSLLLLLVVEMVVAFIIYGSRAELKSLLPKDGMLEVEYFEPTQRINSEGLTITARPLFWSARRPIDQPVILADVKTVVANTQLKKAKLLGVMGQGDNVSVIVLLNKVKHRLSVSESLAGWTLRTVFSGEVVFSINEADAKDYKEVKLQLYDKQPLSKEWENNNAITLEYK